MSSCRGALGFRVGGTDKITYIHSGADTIFGSILYWCSSVTDWKAIKRSALSMKSVGGIATDDQVLEVCLNTGIDLPQSNSWYSLLRPFQGSPGQILQAKFYEQYKDFLYHSKLCEYAYIINLDMGEIEVYHGKQSTKHDNGRYTLGKGQKPDKDGYYPVALYERVEVCSSLKP